MKKWEKFFIVAVFIISDPARWLYARMVYRLPVYNLCEQGGRQRCRPLLFWRMMNLMISWQVKKKWMDAKNASLLSVHSHVILLKTAVFTFWKSPIRFESKESQEMMSHSSIRENYHIDDQGEGTTPGGIGLGTVPALRVCKRRNQKGGALFCCVQNLRILV